MKSQITITIKTKMRTITQIIVTIHRSIKKTIAIQMEITMKMKMDINM